MSSSPQNEVALRVVLSLFALYGFIRILMTMFDKGQMSVRKYWSRFVFRVLMVIHLVTIAIIGANDSESKAEIVVSQLDEITVNCAYMFLARSVQDFASFTKRQIDIIVKLWPFLAVGIVVMNAGIDISVIVRRVADPTDNCYGHYIALIVIQAASIIGLISIPVFMFTMRVRSAMVLEEMKKKVVMSAGVVIGMNTAILVSLLLSIIRRIFPKSIPSWFGLVDMWMRVLVLGTYFVLQDCLDWMAGWMFTDHSATESEDDILREPIIP